MPTTPGHRRWARLYQRNGPHAGAGIGRRAGAVPGAGRGAAGAMGLAALWGAAPAGGFYAICSRTTCWSACSRLCSCSPRWRWALGVRRFWREITPATSGAPLTTPGRCRGDRRGVAPEVPGRRPRRGLPQRGRRPHAGAQALPPPHLLRLHAVLCRDQRGHALPLRVLDLGGALRRCPACPSCWAWSAASAWCMGTAGLWRLNLQAATPLHGDAAQKPMDRGFIALLFLTSRQRPRAVGWRGAHRRWRSRCACTWAR